MPRSKQENREYQKKWYQKNRKKVLAHVKTYQKRNPETYRARQRRHYASNKEYYALRYRSRVYNLSPEQLTEMQIRAGGKCSICGKYVGSKLVIDHDHMTGKVRGMICTACNFALGWVGDNQKILANMITYLKRCGTKSHDIAEGSPLQMSIFTQKGDS